MKILMLTLYLPFPPTSGGQIRSLNLIKNLSEKHEITLVSVIKKGEEKYASELEKYCKEVIYFYRSDKPWTIKNFLRYLVSFYPFLVVRNFSGDAASAIAKKLKAVKFDLIHVETFYLMPHIPKTKVPILLVDQTIEFQVYQHYVNHFKWPLLRPLLNLEVVRLKKWETKFWRKADQVVAVSESDKKTMQSLVPDLPVQIVPNAPGDDLSDLYKLRRKPNFKRPVIFFQSNFLWLQNVEAARILALQVFPLIQRKYPDAICRIVGQHAKSKIGHLTATNLEIVDLETSDIEGIRNAYLSGTVFVAPLWGPGGTRLKILSAMSTGVPVVTTVVGAGGLEVKNEKNILIGESSKELADQTIRLLSNSKLYDALVSEARSLIEKKYDWKPISHKLSKIYEETAKQS